MAGSSTKARWNRVLKYTFGLALCLLTVAAMLAGVQWYWAVAGFGGGLTIIIGKRRIFWPGVTRNANEIICRLIPWYEGNVYLTWLMLPLMAVAMVAAGRDPGNPPWLQFVVIVVLLLIPLFVDSVVRMWRRSVLSITPSTLSIRLAASKGAPVEIRRHFVQSIKPKMIPNGVGGKWLQVEIAYHPADSSDTTKTMMLGPQFTVQPINLANALLACNAGVHDDPNELLDRIAAILRCRLTAGT